MHKAERLHLIMQALYKDRGSTVQELSGRLEVSHMTVRRDLLTLAEAGKVKTFHGSVIPHPSTFQETGDSPYSLIAAGAAHPDSKLRIGRLAASLLEPDDSLIIDCGSTTEYLAKFLPENFSYTALCHSLNIVSEIARKKNCRLLFAGGLFHENTMMFESVEGLAMIRSFRATKAFISASGVSSGFGVTCMNSYERETKKAIIKSSMRRILLVDSSKFDTIKSDYFADLAEFQEIITDAGLSNETANIIRELGIVLRIA